MNNCFIKKEYYFSFQEIVKSITTSNIIPYTKVEGYDSLFYYFMTLLYAYMDNTPLETFSFIEWDTENSSYENANEHVVKMFNVLYGRFYKHAFIKLDHEEIMSTDKGKVVENVINLLSLIEQTFPRYKATLDAYSSQAQTLLAKIKSTSGSGSNSTMLNKHNDTPQNVGSWDTDTYTTDVNKTTTESQSQIVNETDKDTPIMRLNEIQTLYRNLIKDWTDEMERCFYEVEIE